MDDELSPEEYGRRIKAGQQTKFDQRLGDFRSYYDSLPSEDKEPFRAWLQKLKDVEKETLWEASVYVKLDYDIVDEEGNTLRWADPNFTVGTMLAAIRHWDKGEEFTPEGPRP